MMSIPDPVIIVPGITATYLRDDYPISPEFVWTVLKKDYERVILHPNDLRYEANEPARLQADQLFEVAYNELVEELRYNLTDKENQPVPVYPFGYDWRMPLSVSEARLADFIDEVIARTRLMKHYHAANYDKDPKVNLVGHSMGGLIIAGYLEAKGRSAPVNKVVTLATPFQGSFEAVIKVATGTANLGTTPPSSREREMARVTPALYHLIPSFRGSIDTEGNIPRSLLNPDAWQPSVIDSIATIVQRRGLSSKKPKQDALALLRKLLSEARTHQNRIKNMNLANTPLGEKDWLAVIGVGAVTRVHLKIKKKNGKPFFDLNSDDRKNAWPGENTGDGTVPFKGALPPFLGKEKVVLVTPDDYGYWESQDKALSKLSGFHGILPNMNMLHRLIVRFFTDRPDKHNNTWGRPAPGVEAWNPPLALTDKTKE
jgi:pimeloyl-ACP methyl ester carboxylesterase